MQQQLQYPPPAYSSVEPVPPPYSKLEVSTGPKFPARPAKFFFGPARPGPQSMYYKIYTIQFFEILQQNKYNYIKLHSYFPLVQLLYCPSTTVMYNVQLYQ